MRLLSLLFLTIFIATGCSSQKSIDMTATQIEYSAHSRGYYKKIIVENKTVSVTNERNGETIKSDIENTKWNAIIEAFSKVNLEAVSTLKAPTEKRFYDGAAIGSLKITKDGKTYETPGFDNGFPPKEIETLVSLVTDFAKK